MPKDKPKFTQSELQTVIDQVKLNKKQKYPIARKVHNRSDFYSAIWIDCSQQVKRSITISSHIRASKEFNSFLDKHGAVCGLYIKENGVHGLQVRF